MTYIVFNMSNYEDWEQGIVNRNFYIVGELLKSESVSQVVLVDFFAIRPTNKLFGAKRTVRYLWNSLKRTEVSLAHKKGLHLREINASLWGTSKPLYHVSGFGLLRRKKKGIRDVMTLLQNFLDCDDTVLWSYNPFLPELFDQPCAFSVFDAVDHWGYHASYKRQAKELDAMYQLIDKKAGQIFTVSQGLTSLFPSGKARWVPNGIDFEAFQLSEEPSTLPNAVPTIGYVGTIQERIDFDLLEFVLEHHKDKKFVFAGPIWKGVKDRVAKLQNNYPHCSFPGRIPHKKVPQFLYSLDLALIPHRIDKFISTTNPMKMYEYLACGLPVVTTPGAGTEEFKDHLYIEPTAQGFAQAIEDALEADAVKKHQERKESIKQHSWSKRVETMLQNIPDSDKL